MSSQDRNPEQWNPESFDDIFHTEQKQDSQETVHTPQKDTRAAGQDSQNGNPPDPCTSQGKEAEARKAVHDIKEIGTVIGITCIILFIAVSAYMFFSGTINRLSEGNPVPVSRVTYTQSEQEKKNTPDIAAIAKEAQKSVALVTTKDITVTYGIFFQPTEQESEGAGSGVIISDNGETLYILTNYHVIEKSSAGITVTLNDGIQYKAEAKGFDRDNDVALLEVKTGKDRDTSKTSPVRIGKSSDVEIGDSVVAIGNALGYGNSVTAGIISAKDREIETGAGTKLTVIQTDAAINPGNSGGALLDANGNLIGINTAKLSSSYVEGMGYAIPSDTAVKIAEDILTGKTDNSEPGYLNITARDLDAETADACGIKQGVVVGGVQPGGAAYMAGLQQGDIITKVGEKRTKDLEDMKKALKERKKGETVIITLYRQGTGGYQKMETEITLGQYQD